MIDKITNNNINFGNHSILIDVGASNTKKASMKTRLVLNGLPDIFYKTTVFSNYKQKRNAKTFIEAIANRISQIEKKNASVIKKADPDGALDIILDVPGPYIKDKVFIPNILDSDNNPIGTIEINDIPNLLKSKGIKVDKFKTVNAAAGGCVLSKIEKSYPELMVEGSEISYIYPGGGLGSGSILVDRYENKIIPRERQHVKAAFSNKSIEAEGGCATSLVNNYLEFIEAQLTPHHYKNLLKTKNITAMSVTKITPPGSIRKFATAHQIASKQSMDKFMDCIAQLIAIDIAGGKTKAAVLTGKTAEGIIEGVKNNPLYYQKNDALELIKDKISDHLTPVGKTLMGDDFRVVFVPLSDSTEGAGVLIESYNVGNKGWVNIPKNKSYQI